MTDMLVKLYELQVDWPLVERLQQSGISLRKPLGSETDLITDWVKTQFSPGWANETARAISNQPVSCLIAVQAGQLLGFACYDAAALGLFGPMGVAPEHQGKSLGKALLHISLFDMKSKGYGYAIIGWVGPAEFYVKAAGAVAIPNSSPGLWQTALKC
jgi:predicted N-acetyltransferase YhbS